MLETVLISFGVAVLTSAAVCFLTVWETRIRVRRLEVQLSEYEERLVREQKQRAGAASAAARALKLNPLDEALVRQHQGTIEDDTPWWDGLVKK